MFHFFVIMNPNEHLILRRYPDLKELVRIIRDEVLRNQRPPEETILQDEDIMKLLGISKRKLEYMKKGREICYINPPMQRDYFILGDILEWFRKYRVESIDNQRQV